MNTEVELRWVIASTKHQDKSIEGWEDEAYFWHRGTTLPIFLSRDAAEQSIKELQQAKNAGEFDPNTLVPVGLTLEKLISKLIEVKLPAIPKAVNIYEVSIHGYEPALACEPREPLRVPEYRLALEKYRDGR